MILFFFSFLLQCFKCFSVLNWHDMNVLAFTLGFLLCLEDTTHVVIE